MTQLTGPDNPYLALFPRSHTLQQPFACPGAPTDVADGAAFALGDEVVVVALAAAVGEGAALLGGGVPVPGAHAARARAGVRVQLTGGPGDRWSVALSLACRSQRGVPQY